MKQAKTLIRCILLDGFIFTFLALVALVVFVQPTEETMLKMGNNVLIFFGLWALGGVLVFILQKAKIKTLGNILFDPPQALTAQPDKHWTMSFWGIELIVAFVVAFITGLNVAHISIYELTDQDGLVGAMKVFGALFDPNWTILPKAILAVIETIFIAFMATVFAVPIAFVLSFLCAKNIMGNNPVSFGIYATLRTILNVTRSIEPLIWAIVFSVWVGIGPFAGMLALLLHSVASLAKNYSELVECVEEGPIEAIVATGASSLQVVWFAVVPQIILPYTAFTIYRWDINVRMATIIGLVGGGGIGTMIMQYQGQAMWEEVGCLVFVIAFVVWVMDTTSAYIREAIK